MIRDMDLLRRIVLELETRDDVVESGQLHLEGADPDEIAYHCLLLNDQGLIDVACDPFPPSRGMTHQRLMIRRLTNQGHDFAQVIREESQWKVAKALASEAKALTLSALLDVVTQMVKIRITERWNAVLSFIRDQGWG